MRPEEQPRVELDREIVTAYAATFISRFDLYPVQLRKGQYVLVKKNLSMKTVNAGLKFPKNAGLKIPRSSVRVSPPSVHRVCLTR